MKRQLIICGLLVFFVGCGDEAPQTSDDHGNENEIAVEDETFLADGFEGQLTEIDEKLARIEIGLDERLTQIESRLRAVERGPGGTPPAGVAPQPNPPPTDPVSPPADVTPVADNPATETAPVVEPADATVAQATAGNDHPFVGPAQCAPCHLMQFQSWIGTDMAKAFVILKPGERSEAKLKANLDPDKDYTQDETCLPCHVTGYGLPGGFQDEESTPFLAGVSCEMCHGAGGTYLEKGLKKNEQYKKADLVAEGLVDEITIAQCENCHNDRSPFVGEDYVFDFEVNKEKGTHQHYPLQFKH